MPAVFPPGDTTVLDRFTRADGNVWAGAGATLWDDIDMTGAASVLRVSDAKLVASAEGSGLTNESVADGIRVFTITSAASSGYLQFLFRMAGSVGYAFDMSGGTWVLYSVNAGVYTSVHSAGVPNGLTSGVRVGIRFEDDEFAVHLGNSLYMDATPVWSTTGLANTGAGACGFRVSSSVWALDDYASGGLTSPTSAVTIHVDPDHPDASDTYTRSEASSASTPLVTVQQAGWLARADVTWADTILVSVCETEDLGDALDTHLQPALDYRALDRSPNAVGWPFGDNSGNLPITIRGDAAIDLDTGTREDVKATVLPKIKWFRSRGLNNWRVERIQFGYDVDSGNDHATPGNFERVTDMTWSLCHFTGGMGIAQHWTDAFIVDRCVIHSPLGGGGLHVGAGLRMEQNPAEGTGRSIGQLLIDGSEFSQVRGDDALMVGGLYLLDGSEDVDEASENIIRDTLFWNVTEGDPVFHTDSIQFLAVRRAHVDGCTFIGCSTALMASDFRNGWIRMSRSLTVGLNSPVQMQGTDEIEIEQNTFIHTQAPRDATLLFYTRTSLPSKPKLTCRNNILGGFLIQGVSNAGDAQFTAFFLETSVVENNVVLSNPGLSTTFGDNLPGIPEFGYSTRLEAIPNDTVTVGEIPREWELANSPDDSPGIGEGAATTVTEDLFGRAYTSPPDVGAMQSDPGTPVTPVGRSPYILSRSPAENATGVSASASVTVVLYPVPGAEIDGTTVTMSSAYVTDSANQAIPAIVTVSDPDEDGQQTVTVDLKSSVSPLVEGSLLPLVDYTVHLTAGIEDTDGSALSAASWTFRVVGPAGPGIDGPDSGASAFTSVAASSRTTNGCVVTFNSSTLEMTPVGMKQLQSFFDRLTMDTCGDETGNVGARVSIGPLQ